MLKKIATSDLKPGMFLHDLNCGWMEHPFVRSKFEITTVDEIEKIVRAGIREVIIDASRGSDVSYAPTLAESSAKIETDLVSIASTPRPATVRVSVADEINKAALIRDQASAVVKTVMQDARLGRAIEVEQVGTVVTSITESILRNPGALLGILQIKSKDDYTFLHSVSVCALLVAFSASRKLPSATAYEAGLGGLLHDTGKTFVPDSILNKPGALTDDEFAVIKRHPQMGFDLLRRSPELGPIPLDITLHHHERYDGTGYPEKQKTDGISELAQMAAIVDVYDAITADRCYHKGMSAAEALRKMYEWSQFHFNPALVQDFMRCVGIYPVGTLVLLHSGRLGVVIEQHPTEMLTPKVNVFFNTKTLAYIRPEMVDLSKKLGFGGGDKIVRYESPAKWKVDPQRFLAAA